MIVSLILIKKKILSISIHLMVYSSYDIEKSKEHLFMHLNKNGL